MVMVLISSVDKYHNKCLILLDLRWLVLVGYVSHQLVLVGWMHLQALWFRMREGPRPAVGKKPSKVSVIVQ